MSNSFSGPSGTFNALPAAMLGITLAASSAFAGDWRRDEDGFRVIALEQKTDRYIEPEKIAIGCSEGLLFFERFSPAGNAPSSIVRFRDGTELSIEWTKLDGPGAMWAYGPLATLIVNKLRLEQVVSFQEGDRAPIVFHYDQAPSIVDCY
jgi:hypothetical protein